jgi:hypothetical protein
MNDQQPVKASHFAKPGAIVHGLNDLVIVEKALRAHLVITPV